MLHEVIPINIQNACHAHSQTVKLRKNTGNDCIIYVSTSNHHNIIMLSYNPGNHKTSLKQTQLANYASRIRNVTETGHKCMFLFEWCYASS